MIIIIIYNGEINTLHTLRTSTYYIYDNNPFVFIVGANMYLIVGPSFCGRMIFPLELGIFIEQLGLSL